MKKTIAILLVAILAVSSVFAGFSGKASVGFGGNLDNGNFGFIDQSAKVQFDIDLATATAEQIADGDVYASIKATLGVKLTNGEKTSADGDLYEGPRSMGIIADITEAKVAGENWSVSILGLSDAPNFAESAIDTYTVKNTIDKYGLAKADYDKAYNYGVAFEKAPGVEVSVFDYVFGVGLLGDYSEAKDWELKDNLKFSLYAKTPEYDFSGVKFQFGGVYSYSAFDKLDEGKVVKYADVEQKNAIGLSGKVGFENDTITASLAADMGFNLEAEKKDVFDMDLAANFGWNFITVDAYYATEAVTSETQKVEAYTTDKIVGMEDGFDIDDPSTWNPVYETRYRAVAGKTDPHSTEDILSFQAKFDLNAMDVPVAITASVKDVLKTVELGVKAEVTAIENLKITANAGYVVNTYDAYNKDFNDSKDGIFLGQWKLGADVEYDFGFAKVAAGVSVKNIGAKAFDEDNAKNYLSEDIQKDFAKVDSKSDLNALYNSVILGLSASVSTDQIIPGAELKLAWEDADDVLGIYRYDVKDDNTCLGKITASCSISF